ncbi:MAG: hypothetical protein LBV33_05160 [Lachnospiraceae bacterium]|jgi:hypothetical protein|nr:hypothetical protein [Lachnospiraceae bacterium]
MNNKTTKTPSITLKLLITIVMAVFIASIILPTIIGQITSSKLSADRQVAEHIRAAFQLSLVDSIGDPSSALSAASLSLPLSFSLNETVPAGLFSEMTGELLGFDDVSGLTAEDGLIARLNTDADIRIFINEQGLVGIMITPVPEAPGGAIILPEHYRTW